MHGESWERVWNLLIVMGKFPAMYSYGPMHHLNNMANVAVVTGDSSGIGYETSLLLARNQFTTYGTMRNLNKSEVFRGNCNKDKDFH